MADATYLRKKLLFQCQHRGTRELDLVLGPFAQANLETMDRDELLALAAFLNEPDPDIYDWLTGHTTLPDRLRSPAIDRLVAFGRARLGGQG